jgi:hypothetical protein
MKKAKVKRQKVKVKTEQAQFLVFTFTFLLLPFACLRVCGVSAVNIVIRNSSYLEGELLGSGRGVL